MKRIMLAAAGSGSGKTIVTCGLLQVLKDRGCKVTAYKCGPDYIDPMFHRRVIGVEGDNLDTFFSSNEEIHRIIAESDSDTAVMEGVMGIYDGLGGTSRDGSSYSLAVATETPILLIFNARGMGQTMLSLIKGIILDDTEKLIHAIVLNRISEGFFKKMKPMLEDMFASMGRDIRVVGFIPNSKAIKLESRHLGLMMPGEIDDLRDQIKEIAGLIEENCDVDAVIEVMKTAREFDTGLSLGDIATDEAERAADEGDSNAANSAKSTEAQGQTSEHRFTVAVARDEAFCFYYRQNIKVLEQLGAKIIEFSPLHDERIPEGADMLLLGGGYPELYAEQLEANKSMRDSVKAAIEGGLPSLAECGGFMYLFDELVQDDGTVRKMAGVMEGRSFNTGKLNRFGYVELEFPGGFSAKGHEFHYYDTTDNGEAVNACKPGGSSTYTCMHVNENHIWGFPHLYYNSCRELIADFIGRICKK